MLQAARVIDWTAYFYLGSLARVSTNRKFFYPASEKRDRRLYHWLFWLNSAVKVSSIFSVKHLGTFGFLAV